MEKLSILLWDIDGTVLNFEAAEAAAVRTGFSRMDFGECSDEMLADYSAINVRYWECLERGEMSKPEILVGRFREFFAKYGLDAAKAEAFNRQYQLDLGDTVCFNDDAYELIAGLKGRFRQYAASNGTARAQHKKLTLSGLDRLFDYCFISDEIGFEKPSAGFFDAVFAKMTEQGPVTRGEVMIIGDSLTSDMAGGSSYGIRTCWYNPKGKPNTSDLKPDYEIRNLWELLPLLEELK